MSETKVVKRYANRKLYDTHKSCYVTLEDIAQMIRDRDEVVVVDNKSGEDLTAVTLAQIIFEAEKRRHFVSLAVLRKLVQEGGSALGELARGSVDRVQAKASEVRQSAQKLRDDLEGKLDRVIRGGEGSEGNVLLLLATRARQAFEELQSLAGQRLRGPEHEGAGGGEIGEDMEEIQRRLAALEGRLEQISRP